MSLEADLTSAQKKEIRGIAVLACLIVFVLTYMTWLYTQLAKLDASVLTRIVGAKVEESLPEMQLRLRDELVRMTPDIVREAETFVLESPARFRAELEVRIVEEARRLTAKVEAELDKYLTENLQHTIALLKQANASATPESAFDELLAEVRAEYKTKIKTLLDGMYFDYRSAMDRVHSYLVRLENSPNLTEPEKLDKQIIECWVVLVYKHNFTTPSVK